VWAILVDGSIDDLRIAVRLTPMVSSRRAVHSAERRSRPSERKASALARRSMVKRETPATAASRSMLE